MVMVDNEAKFFVWRPKITKATLCKTLMMISPNSSDVERRNLTVPCANSIESEPFDVIVGGTLFFGLWSGA